MEELLKEFRQTVEASSQRLLLISEEQSGSPRAPGKWSPKQIIGHLIDSASNNHQRFVRAQFSDDLTFAGYDQEAWVRVQDYDKEEWALLVQLWKYYNLHLLHVMAAVPEKSLARPRHRHNLDQIAWKGVPQNEPVTLLYFMRDYVAHLKNHLNQIFSDSNL
ncbi:MAG TPA: DinB family protein [Pyrinomonadaceae bacterium]|nr:DinB family protein [Pyrinomonadaceae bacterium]